MEHNTRQFSGSDWSMDARKTDSGVSETPVTRKETADGAYKRINYLKALLDRQK